MPAPPRPAEHRWWRADRPRPGSGRAVQPEEHAIIAGHPASLFACVARSPVEHRRPTTTPATRPTQRWPCPYSAVLRCTKPGDTTPRIMRATGGISHAEPGDHGSLIRNHEHGNGGEALRVVPTPTQRAAHSGVPRSGPEEPGCSEAGTAGRSSTPAGPGVVAWPKTSGQPSRSGSCTGRTHLRHACRGQPCPAALHRRLVYPLPAALLASQLVDTVQHPANGRGHKPDQLSASHNRHPTGTLVPMQACSHSKFGARFSRKAVRPSFASPVSKRPCSCATS